MSNESSPSVVVAAGTEPTAVNSTAQPTAPVSIIVPCCGQLEYTRYCLFSLLRHSRAPFELFCLDISSLDGTTEYLTGIATAAPAPVHVLRAESAADFKAVCDQALATARGDYVVWLNNDTIVPQRWLQHLVSLAGAHPQIGMVGPMANYGPPAQRVDEVPYHLGAKVKGPATVSHKVLADDIAAVNQFAAEWREKNKGQSAEVDRLGGFCLLIKKEVLKQVPLLDDQAGEAVFDADSLCRRVRQAGYHLGCCRDLYIHHFGSRLASSTASGSGS